MCVTVSYLIDQNLIDIDRLIYLKNVLSDTMVPSARHHVGSHFTGSSVSQFVSVSIESVATRKDAILQTELVRCGFFFYWNHDIPNINIFVNNVSKRSLRITKRKLKGHWFDKSILLWSCLEKETNCPKKIDSFNCSRGWQFLVLYTFTFYTY